MGENHNGESQTSLALPVVRLPQRREVEETISQIEAFRLLVHHALTDKVDFGKIPGTGDRKTLLKPGAEKIVKLLRLAATYEIMDKTMEWDRGLFQYEIRCVLVSMDTGAVVDQGVGECNSFESKYRYRQGRRTCPDCKQEAIIKGKRDFGGGWICFKKQGGCGRKWQDGDAIIESQDVGRVINEDPADQINTFLKIAKKRSLVDAALSVGSLSDLFTQDLEDLPPEDPPAVVNHQPAAPPRAQPAAARVDPPAAPAPTPVQATAPQPAAPEEPEGAAETVDPLRFENVGHLMTAAKDHLHLTYQDVKNILEVEAPSQITDLVVAWRLAGARSGSEASGVHMSPQSHRRKTRRANA